VSKLLAALAAIAIVAGAALGLRELGAREEEPFEGALEAPSLQIPILGLATAGLEDDLAAGSACERLAAMRAAPADHRGERVTSAELGEPGCRHWQVRPRLGLIGRLAGWWRVKLSSGCP
jgi:hypothetical protein